MTKKNPAEIIRLVYRAIDWQKLYDMSPDVTREDVEDLFALVKDYVPSISPAFKSAAEPAPAGSVVIFTDGASLGNPGPSGIGVVIQAEDGRTIERISRYIGEKTNNQAEYEAVLFALARAKALGARQVSLRTDSELLMRQVKCIYRVKHPGIKPLFEKAAALLREFEKWDVMHIPREQNSEADKLAAAAAQKAKDRERN